MNKAVHYSWAQLVHDLYHGFVIILEGKTFIESAIFITASHNVKEFTLCIGSTSNHSFVSWLSFHLTLSMLLSPCFNTRFLIHLGNIHL